MLLSTITSLIEEAKAIIEEQRSAVKGEPKNLEEQAISLVGEDIYRKLIKGYTEKQWGRSCTELPSFIIKRLPVRYIYDNNYFNDLYQGIPMGGYNVLTDKLFDGCDIMLNTDYNDDREKFDNMADKVLYTGTLDSLFDYCQYLFPRVWFCLQNKCPTMDQRITTVEHLKTVCSS